MLDLDALLDQSMDAVEAAPDFVEPDTGVYILNVSKTEAAKQKSKDTAKPDYVRLKHIYKIEEQLETEGTMPIAPGSLFVDSWMLSDEGLRYFKSRSIAIAVAAGAAPEDLSGLTTREFLAGAEGLTFKCQITKTPRTDDPNRYNIRLSNISAVEA